MNTRGVEMQTHIAATMSKSKKGTLAVEWKKTRMVLKKIKMAKHNPGNAVAVKRVQSCQFWQRKVLHMTLETYPAKDPQSMYKTRVAVMRLPRRAGLKNPTAERQMVKKAHRPI